MPPGSVGADHRTGGLLGEVVGAWLGLAALGAGLVHLGVAASSAGVPLAVFAVLGVAEVLWGVVALARREGPHRASGLAVALLPPIAWAALLAAGVTGHEHAAGGQQEGSALPAVALAIATLLDLGVAIGASLLGRTRRRAGTGPEGQWVRLAGVAVGAAAVAVLTTSALASTGVGQGHGH